MAKGDSNALKDVDALIATLRGYLHSEMSISQPKPMTFGRDSGVRPPDQEGVEISVTVRNDAPPSEHGGEVVFMGVGLRISDGREQGIESLRRLRWVRGIRKTPPSDRRDMLRKYEDGAWVSGFGQGRFPALTRDEESFGDVLFPGESVVYEMQIPVAYLPYTKITVEGTVSRRHLLHFTQPMKGLEHWTRPLLVETFRALNAVDIHAPLLTATNGLPVFGPQTTLEQITACREALSEAINQIEPTMQTLNNVFHAAPNQEIRDHMKQIVGRHLGAIREACESAAQVLSSGDTTQMRNAANALKQQLAASHEVDRKTLELMSRFGITPEEANFSRRTT